MTAHTPRRRHRIIWLLGGGAFLLFLIALLCAVTLYVRLMFGEVSGDWLNQVVDTRLNAAKPAGMVLKYDRLSVSLTAGGQPVVRLTDLVLSTPDERINLSVSRANIVVDGRAFLFGGLKIKRVDLVGGEMTVLLPYMENGPLQRPVPFGVAFVDTGLQIVRDAMDGLLETATLGDMKVSFTRPGWSRSIDYYTSNAKIDWLSEGLRFDGAYVGTDGSWTVSLDRERPVDGEPRSMSLRIRDVVLRDLMGVPRLADAPSEVEPGLQTTGFGLSLDMDARFDGDGQLTDVTITTEAAPGRIGSAADPVAEIESFGFTIGWRQGMQELSVDRLRFVSGRTSLEAEGSFRAPWFTTDKRGELLLKATAPVFAFSDDGEVETVSLQLHAIVDQPRKQIELVRVDLVTREAAVTGTGTLAYGGTFPEIEFAGKLRDVGFKTALALWPPVFGADARKWAERHLKAGMIDSAELQFRLSEGFFDGDPATPAWSDEEMVGSFEVHGLDLLVINALPSVPGLKVRGELSGGRVVFASEPVTVRLASGLEPQLTGGDFVLEDVRERDARVTVAVGIDGTAAAVGEIIEGFVPNLVRGAGIVPGELSGDAVVDTTFVFQPSVSPNGAPVAWSAEGAISEFGSGTAVQGRMVEDGELTFSINQSRARVSGKVSLDSLPADIDIDRSLLELQGGIGFGVAFTLDPETRKRIGLDLGDALTGSVDVLLVDAPGTEGRGFEVNLTNADINLSALGFRKPSGVQSSARFRLVESDGVRRVEDLSVATDRPILTGAIVLDGSGLRSADLRAVKISPDDDLNVLVERQGNGFDINLDGSQIDLRPLISAARWNTGGGGASFGDLPITLSGRVNRVIGHGQVSMSDVDLSVALGNAGLTTARLNGQLSGTPLKMSWVTDGGWRNIQLETADLGSLLRFSDLYARIRGGAVELGGRLPTAGSGETGSGTVLIRDFVLEDEARVEQVTSQIARDSNPRYRPAANAQGEQDGGLVFSKLSGSFTQQGGILKVSEVAVQGLSIGAVASGAINLGTRRIDLRGTFIPLYGVNNLFGRVPVLGQIFGGGQRGGLLGLTFRYFGPLSKPELSINPASLLTPGIFRKVFGFEPLAH